MKIITDEQYKKIATIIDALDNTEVPEKTKEIDSIKKDHAKEIKNLKEDYELKIERLEQSVEYKVLEETKQLRIELAETEAEKQNFENKVEILEQAFENLGFDVKDMKEILNKLVDGIISKNTIQLVK